MLYSNDSIKAVYACEYARTGGYGYDADDYYDEEDDDFDGGSSEDENEKAEV